MPINIRKSEQKSDLNAYVGGAFPTISGIKTSDAFCRYRRRAAVSGLRSNGAKSQLQSRRSRRFKRTTEV